MATVKDLSIKISLKDENVKAGLAKIKSIFADFGNGIRKYKKTLQDLNGEVKRFSSDLVKLGGALTTYFSFKNLTESAIEFTKTLENTRLGLKSLIYTMNEFYDAQGRLLEGQKKWAAAGEYAKKVQEELRIEGLKTVATYEQLARAFNQAYVPAIRAGFNEKQIVEFTTAVVNAASAMGISLDMLGEEVRSILSGTMQVRTTLLKPLMDAAGLTNEKIRELAKSGKLYEAVMKALQGAVYGANEAQYTWQGVMSNTKDAIQQLLAQGLKPFINEIKDTAIKFQHLIYTVKDGKIVFNEELVGALQSVGNALSKGIKLVWEYGIKFKKFIELHKEGIKKAGEFVLILLKFSVAIKAAEWIYGLVKAIKAYIIAIKEASIASKSFLAGLLTFGALEVNKVFFDIDEISTLRMTIDWLKIGFYELKNAANLFFLLIAEKIVGLVELLHKIPGMDFVAGDLIDNWVSNTKEFLSDIRSGISETTQKIKNLREEIKKLSSLKKGKFVFEITKEEIYKETQKFGESFKNLGKFSKKRKSPGPDVEKEKLGDIKKEYISELGDDYAELLKEVEIDTKKIGESFSEGWTKQWAKIKTLPEQVKEAWEEYKAEFPELAEYVKKEAEAIGNSFKDGFVPRFKEITGDIQKETEEWVKIVKEISQEMENAFSNFFYDVFMGKIHSMKEALSSFMNTLQSAIARIASQKLAEGIISWAGGFFSGIFKKHEGGYIPKFHIGGLASDEIPAILQKGEYVIRRSAVELLDRVNQGDLSVFKGGESKVEQYQPVVLNMSINTTDPISFESYVKRNKGAIQKMIIRDILNNGQLIHAIREAY